MTNDLTILHDAWGVPESPSPAARASARAALLAHVSARPRPAARRLRMPRLALAGALALAIAAGATLVDLGGGDGRHRSVVPGLPPVQTASAAVLERAAKAAEKKPFVAPRFHQWIYVKDRFSPLGGGPAHTEEMWHQANGDGIAYLDVSGQLHVVSPAPPKHSRPRSPLLHDGYEGMASLPTDPAALRAWAYELAKHTTGGGEDDNGDVYLIFDHMLRDNIVPPDLEAAIFRVLKTVPGVTVEQIDVAGKPALSVGMGTSDWLHEELLLDPQTYEYIGERSTITKDTIVNKEKVGNNTGEVRKGQQVAGLRLAIGIVDKPGERP
jgi:hypothetical protein